MVRAGKRRRKGERMVRKQTKVAPHPPRGSRRASPSPRSAGRGKEAAERAETDAHREIDFDPPSETLDATIKPAGTGEVAARAGAPADVSEIPGRVRRAPARGAPRAQQRFPVLVR